MIVALSIFKTYSTERYLSKICVNEASSKLDLSVIYSPAVRDRFPAAALFDVLLSNVVIITAPSPEYHIDTGHIHIWYIQRRRCWPSFIFKLGVVIMVWQSTPWVRCKSNVDCNCWYIKADVHAKGQGHRAKVKVTEVTTPLNRFPTVTPVWIHICWWNDAYSLMLLRTGALLFFKAIRQISISHGSENRRIWPKLGVSGL